MSIIDHHHFPKNCRILVTSDIHGNLEGFKALLEQVKYQADTDYLVIVGDLCEKGCDSAGLVRFVRELQDKHSDLVWVIRGNCDEVYQSVLEDDPDIVSYLIHREHSLLNEWLSEVGYQVRPESTVAEIQQHILQSHHERDIEFLLNLPHVIETESFIFVHAGLEDRQDWENSSAETLLSMPRFYDQTHQASQIVVVGHYPVSAYQVKNRLSFNPILDQEKRIFSIDGGNVIKQSGQLNVLIIQKENEHFLYTSDYVKCRKQVVAVSSYAATDSDVGQVTWPEYDVVIHEQGEDFSQCTLMSGKTVWIKNEMIDFETKACMTDTTSFRFSYQPGDCFELIRDDTSTYWLVKSAGVLGWIRASDVVLVEKKQLLV